MTKGDASDRRGSDGKTSSSVEKAAERMLRVSDANLDFQPEAPVSESDKNRGSIERMLDASPENLSSEEPGPPLAREESPAPVAEAGSTPIDDAVATPPDHGQVPLVNDPAEAGAPGGGRNPYRHEAPQPAQPGSPEADDWRQASATLPAEQEAEPAAAPPRAQRRFLGKKSKIPKPWHRVEEPDTAETQNYAIDRAVEADQPLEDEAPRRRGLFGGIWAVIRFLLIGKKRQKKPRLRKPGKKAAPGRRGPRLAGVMLKLRRSSRRLPAMPSMPNIPAVGRIKGRLGRGNRNPEVGLEPESELPSSLRGEADGHMHRPLDLSRRVGRTVEIDFDKLRATGILAPFGERSHIAEEFRLIKRPLLLNAFEEGPNAIRNGNVIMVASSRSGEGKTFTAINLAMSIASERDLTVLLIDADVAKPDVPNVLGFETDIGLVDLIADDQVDVSDVIMRTNIENFSVMPAGRPHHLATELMASERMGMLVTELSLRYPERVIILDSPPALLSSIAGVLALNVGQILFVVEAERTSQTAVDSAIGLVSACKNINLLLNKSRPLGNNERFGAYQSGYY